MTVRVLFLSLKGGRDVDVLQELLAKLDYKETTDTICGFIADQVAINNARGLVMCVVSV